MNIDEILNFGKYEENERIINEVTGIYTSINLEDVGNMPNDEMNYFVQVFNESNRKYELKFIKNIDNLDEIKYRRINSCDSDYLFDIKHFNLDNSGNSSSNKLYLITKESIKEIDLNSDDINNSTEIIKLPGGNDDNPIKICSDGSKFDPKQVAIGINETLFFVDLNSNKIINKVDYAHYNGILSCEFDPFKSFILSTAGMDYSVKYWDIRKLTTPFATITNDSHWVWDLKYNKQFSRVMISSSSSSIVRGIISSFKESEDIHNLQDQMKGLPSTMIDYVEFEDAVYSLDWSMNDPWIFAAVSYNSYVHINSIPEDIKYQIMLDN